MGPPSEDFGHIMELMALLLHSKETCIYCGLNEHIIAIMIYSNQLSLFALSHSNWPFFLLRYTLRFKCPFFKANYLLFRHC